MIRLQNLLSLLQIASLKVLIKFMADKFEFLICKTKFVKVSKNSWLRHPKLASQYASAMGLAFVKYFATKLHLSGPMVCQTMICIYD